MNSTGARRTWAVSTAAMFAVMVAVNGMANALPLNGVNTGQLSDEIPNLFVPAGITFAVWGVIYALLLGYAVAVLREGFRPEASGGPVSAGEAWVPADGMLFSANAALNAAWILAWHWRLVPLSVAIMAGILATLVMLTERNHARTAAKAASRAADTSGGRLSGFLLRVPLLVYLGWICVATIANVTALLVTSGWDGSGIPQLWWTVAMIAVGTAVGCILVVRRGAVSSGLVVIWAYAGIVMKRTGIDAASTTPIIVAAYAGIAAVALAIAAKLAKTLRRS